MKIVLDIDGTLTDFNMFVLRKGYPYFMKKYGMEPKYPNKLEIEDIFDMDNFFKEKYHCSEEEAKKYTKKALDKFWISLRFITFSALNSFRPGVRDFIREKTKEGHVFEVHSSRGETCKKNIVGFIARNFTILQFRKNGVFIPAKNFHFYPNDKAKVEGIIASNADLAFDDKPEIVEKLSQNGIKCMCVRGLHNKEVENSKMVRRLDFFDERTLKEELEQLFGVKNLTIYNRAAKSDILFAKLFKAKPLILRYFKPIVLHGENLVEPKREGVLYAPNHRSTLDPIAITTLIGENVHWAALLRFFQGKDSIFNNSKNPLLCDITAKTFKGMEYFPIDRKSDNPQANNLRAIIDMTNFLKNNQRVGIFPEGTTRRPEGADFGTFDDSFILLAKRTNAWIQPITTFWIKDLDLPEKLIVNIGEPFKVGSMSREEAYEHFLVQQQIMLEENKRYAEELKERKKLTKKL